jgi:hypothetical protein
MLQVCGICLERVDTDSVLTHCCQSPFHKDCLSEWLKRGSVCPFCRKTIPSADFTIPVGRVYSKLNVLFSLFLIVVLFYAQITISDVMEHPTNRSEQIESSGNTQCHECGKNRVDDSSLVCTELHPCCRRCLEKEVRCTIREKRNEVRCTDVHCACYFVKGALQLNVIFWLYQQLFGDVCFTFSFFFF